MSKCWLSCLRADFPLTAVLQDSAESGRVVLSGGLSILVISCVGSVGFALFCETLAPAVRASVDLGVKHEPTFSLLDVASVRGVPFVAHLGM